MKAIILAAGNSKRFCGNKLLEPFHGKPLYRYTVDMALSLPFEEIILVTQYEDILKEGQKRKEAGENLTVVHNDCPEEGIARSIRLGTIAAGKGYDLMFFVCDQPFLKRESLLFMMQTFEEEKKGKILCAACKDGFGKEKTGNPNIFSRCYYEEFFSLLGEQGGKKIIRNHLDEVKYFYMDEKELIDFDYREDFDTAKDGILDRNFG
ncbi:MAG: nucleotidyltransferase family protein [Lachnospiraceae bacterium]|nr:nucleotidyltransferase family protein [Lachnospiraceae bacterium]